MDQFLRDFGLGKNGVFFCRAVDSVMVNRRYCANCPLAGIDEKGRNVCQMVSAEFNRQFPDYPGSTPLMLKAFRFAEMAHRGRKRKGNAEPYFVHLMESAGIARTLTSDEEVVAAALLHDVIEDTGFGYEDLEHEFGNRIAELVQAVSEDKMRDRSPEDTWYERKAAAIAKLATAERDVKIIVLADKLSNIRSTYEEYQKQGDNLWKKFNQKDKQGHAWYYREVLLRLGELSQTTSYEELRETVENVFGREI